MPMAKISDVPGTARPLHDALAAQGWSTLADLDGVSRTTLLNLHGVGEAGTGRSDIATVATGADVVEFSESLSSAKRIEQGHAVLRIFGEVTGVEPRMWGSSMIGYGEMHYQYATGREGDTMVNKLEDIDEDVLRSLIARAWGADSAG